MTAPVPPTVAKAPDTAGLDVQPDGQPAGASLEAFNRNRLSMSILALDPRTTKPDRHYRWVRAAATEYNQSVTKHKIRGYQVETLKGGVKTVVESDSRADGAICRGDLILMSCPRALHEKRDRERHARGEQMLAATSAATEERAREKGVKLIRDPDHNSVKTEIR